MCKCLFRREFKECLTDVHYWRDNPYYFSCLNVRQLLSVHEGCVNTVCWDENGEFLLTGSDDRHVCVTPVFSTVGHETVNKPIFDQKLPADSNVFIAKFLPQTCNSQVIAGFKCGCVLKVNIDRCATANVDPVFCHKYAVYDVLTFPDHPTCFMTLSHDQSVVCFDTRLPFGFNPISTVCSQRCSLPVGQPFTTNSNTHAGVACMTFQFPVTAGDVHSLSGSHCIALASADGFVRLFDLRHYIRSGMSSPVGNSIQPLPFRVVRPLGLPVKLSDDRTIRLDYGPAHITSVQFEPIYSVGPDRFVSGAPPSDSGGRRLLVSHMYAPVFLFDLKQTETSPDPDAKSVAWLPSSRPEATDTTSNGDGGSPRGQSTFQADPAVRIALAFFCWFERQRNRRRTAEAAASSDELVNVVDSTPAFVDENTAEATGPEEESPTSESRLSPLEKLTDEYVAQVLQSAPRLRQLMEYHGRRSCRTVIKTATFWGREYILSGSECGHVIAWNRRSGQPVNAIKADDAVVNRIAPHPTLPMLACSGIDSTVKIIEPDPRLYECDGEEQENFYKRLMKKQMDRTSELCVDNSDTMIESLRAGSLLLDRLARLSTGRALRAVLRRFASSRRPNNDVEPPE